MVVNTILPQTSNFWFRKCKMVSLECHLFILPMQYAIYTSSKNIAKMEFSQWDMFSNIWGWSKDTNRLTFQKQSFPHLLFSIIKCSKMSISNCENWAIWCQFQTSWRGWNINTMNLFTGVHIPHPDVELESKLLVYISQSDFLKSL